MAEQSGDHPFESHMPPRETSLEDFVKLENYCSQDKSDDDVGLLGDFNDPKIESGSQLLVGEKDEPLFSHKEADLLDLGLTSGETNIGGKGSVDAKDYDPYWLHGSAENRYLGKLDEKEESVEKYSKDNVGSGPTVQSQFDDFGFDDKINSSQMVEPPKVKAISTTVPVISSQPAESEPMHKSPTELPTKPAEGGHILQKKEHDSEPQKKEAPTSTTCGCPFSPSALFDSARLNRVVSNLLYWRDLKKSGLVFGAILFLLISMRFFSLISISAYLILAVLGVTISFRVYKNILQAVQKSNDGHPFRDYLEMDIALPEEKAREMAEVMVKHLNCAIKKIRSLFLVEDLVDSIKLSILLWIMTYVGAWFNGLTLVTIAFVIMFSVPKVYETYKVQIDQYLEIACSQVTGVLQMVKSKLPFGQKDKQQ